METPTLERPPAGAPAIDPRIRARRIAVHRQRGRRRLARLVDLSLVLLVAALFVGSLWTPLLDVSEIRVTGTDRVAADQIAKAAGVRVGDPLVEVDLTSLGRRLTALPWVQEVALHRGLDGVVAIDITEHQPAALLQTASGTLAVEVGGRVLGPASQLDDATALVTVSGSEGASPGQYVPAATRAVLVLAWQLAELSPGAAAVLDSESFVATLRSGGEVHFGDASRAEAKARALAALVDQVDLTCLDRIDLSLPSNAVLTREEGCS